MSAAAGAEGSESGLLGAARAFGVMLGPPVAASALAGASLLSVARSAARGSRPRGASVLGALATCLYVFAVRPRIRRWGASPAEADMPLPGDELEPDPSMQTTRAVTIEAPPDQVWPWLAQLGQERGASTATSGSRTSPAARCEMPIRSTPNGSTGRSARRSCCIRPPGSRLTLFEPGRVFGIEGWGAFVLEPGGEGRTRLLARGRTPRKPLLIAYASLLEIPHFVMERRMLLGIKQRAERALAQAGS